MITSAKPEFRFRLDLHTGVPVYRQIIDQFRGALASGALSTGDQLPTVRQLAVDLSINPNTVVRAYKELELSGQLETHQGTGTFISGQKMTGGGYSRKAKRYRTAIRGRSLNLVKDFGPRFRYWWEGNGLKVPDAKLFMSRDMLK